MSNDIKKAIDDFIIKSDMCVGDHIREELEIRKWSIRYFSDISKVDKKVIFDILRNRQEITSEIAEKISAVFGTSKEFWLNLQHIYKTSKRKYLEKKHERK